MPLDNAGNTLATATTIATTVGRYTTSFTDRVDGTDPQDYYKFQVVGRSSFSARVSDLGGDVKVNLLNSSGTVVKSSDNAGLAEELIVDKLLNPGTYYLQITPGTNSAGSDYRYLNGAQFLTGNALQWANGQKPPMIDPMQIGAGRG
jgi:hypothetical protein